MNYVYRFRLYPTKEQERFLKKEAGNIRFVYNYFLALAKEKYQKEKICICCHLRSGINIVETIIQL